MSCPTRIIYFCMVMAHYTNSFSDYLFPSYILLPRFWAEYHICKWILLVISLLLWYFWWLCLHHRKSNSSSSFSRKDRTSSWEVTGHSARAPWILKSWCHNTINCCFTFYNKLHCSVLESWNIIGLYYSSSMICCMCHKLLHYTRTKPDAQGHIFPETQ